MGSTPKQIVADGYDLCGPAYNATREGKPFPEIERLRALLGPGASVLDIGCGGASSVASALAKSAAVTGVGISRVQVAEAQARFPNARFIAGDIMAQDFGTQSFDAIVSLYAIFHIPREEHGLLLERVARWLRPGGYLIAMVGNSSHTGYTDPDFFGVTMYWSHFETSWYEGMLRRLGFELLEHRTVGHGYRASASLPSESHPVLFAQCPQRRADQQSAAADSA